jgi:surface antigen
MMVTMTAKKASEYASQPIRGDHFFTHSAPSRVSKTPSTLITDANNATSRHCTRSTRQLR